MEKAKDHICEDCGRFVANDEWGHDFLDEFQRCGDCRLYCEECREPAHTLDEFQRCFDCSLICLRCDRPAEAVDSRGWCRASCSEEKPCSKCGRMTEGWFWADDGVDELGRCTDCSVHCECCNRDVEALSDVVPDECPFCARITKELEVRLPEDLREGGLAMVFRPPRALQYGPVDLQYGKDSQVGEFLDEVRIIISVVEPQEAEPFVKQLEEQLMSLMAKHSRLPEGAPAAELRACSMMQLCDAVKIENKDKLYAYLRGRQVFTFTTAGGDSQRFYLEIPLSV